MDSAERRDTLVRLLRRGGLRSVRQLADELEVSRRTVLRDLSVLRARGYRLATGSGRGGGVQLDPSSVLVASQLSTDEVVSLVLSVATLRAAPWMPFASGAERALAKIEGSLPRERARALREVMRRIFVGDPSPPASARDAGTVDPKLLLAFEQALTQERVLRFDYTDRYGHATRRVVEAHGLLVRAPLWYIVAWDIAKDAPRLFRMDRIRAPRITDATVPARSLDFIAGACPDARLAAASRRSERGSGA